MEPPRRVARGREEDRLVIYLTFSGNDPLSYNEYNQTTSQMAERFYKTSGSLTHAIRTVAETLNQSLVDRNLRTTGKGQYIIGRLILGVLRASQFVFAQCGPTHVFHLSGGEAHHVHDTQISGRGLGIGQATPLYLSQLNLNPGDNLVLCADLASGWETALQATSPGSLEALRRLLLPITGDDLNAIIIEAQNGKGSLNIMKALPVSAPGTAPAGQKEGRLGRSARQASRSKSQAQPPATSKSVIDSSGGTTSAGTYPASKSAPDMVRPSSQVESEQPASRFARLLAGEEISPQQITPQPEPVPSLKDAPATETPPKVDKLKEPGNAASSQPPTVAGSKKSRSAYSCPDRAICQRPPCR